mgnify:CR=1 FL=1
MEPLYLVQGDNGSQVKVVITRDDTGLPVDLTSATAKLKFKKKNTSNVLSELTSSTVVAAELEEGIAIFFFSSSNLDIIAGSYVGEVQVTFESGYLETIFEQIEFVVREDY